MNKKVLSAVMLCASLFTLSATAQNPKARNQNCPVANCNTEAVCNNPKQCAQPGECCSVLFEGITLTEAQKSKIQDIQKARVEKRKARAAESKETAKTEKRKMREERDAARKADKRAYLDGVKQVLTPEQYVIFLENAYMAPAPEPRMGHDGRHQGVKPAKFGARKGGDNVVVGRGQRGGKLVKADKAAAKTAEVKAAE